MATSWLRSLLIDVPLGLRLGHERERALGAEQHLGVGDDLAHGVRHGFEAVVADADDVDFVEARGWGLGG